MREFWTTWAEWKGEKQQLTKRNEMTSLNASEQRELAARMEKKQMKEFMTVGDAV